MRRRGAQAGGGAGAQAAGRVNSASSTPIAIRDTAMLMPKTPAFHIWLEHVSIGTTAALNMRHDAETLANRLKLLHGQFRV